MKTFNKIIHSTVIISLMLIYSACEKEYPRPECNYNIHIPDTALKNALLNAWVIWGDNYESYLDNNKDGEICDGEANGLEWLFINDSNIRNLEGLEHFKNLSWLDCNECNIESISFSSNSIKRLDCDNNLLSNLDISNMKNLEELSCTGNNLTELNLSENYELKYLVCSNNLLSSIDVSNLNLGILHINNNDFTTLNVSGLESLFSLKFKGNKIGTIDLSDNIELSSLSFAGNPISEIDLSNNPDLTWLEFGDNPMTMLDVSVNQKLRGLTNSGEFSLEKICVWTLPFPPLPSDPFTDVKVVNFPASFDGFEICD